MGTNIEDDEVQWENSSWLLKMAIGPKFAACFARDIFIYFFFGDFGLRLRHQAGPDNPKIASGDPGTLHVNIDDIFVWKSVYKLMLFSTQTTLHFYFKTS